MTVFPYKYLLPLLFVLSGCIVLPETISNADRQQRVETDLLAIYGSQEPINGRIDFAEAVARALKYNVDKKLQEFEAQISRRAVKSATLDMLPDIVSNAGYSGRDSYRASSSRDLVNNTNSIGASTSEDKKKSTAGLTFSWNILDFGVSYYRAKQNADKFLIATERRVKVSQNIIMDVRDAYWQAVAADQVLPQVNTMIERINAATRKSDTAIESGLAAPLTELKYQRSLLTLMGDLVEVRRNLASSKAKLASLMNLKPGTQFQISGGGDKLRVPRITGNINSLRIAALTNRPELREEDYNGRIAKLDTTIQKLKLLPGIDLAAGANFDSNSFLLDNGWNQASVAISLNLIELVRGPRLIRLAQEKQELVEVRRQAMSMAILAQLHLALQRLALSSDLFKVTARTKQVDRRISKVLRDQSGALAAAEVDLLEAEANRVTSLVRYYAAYAQVQNAYGRVLNSLGSHRFPYEAHEYDLKDLTRALRKSLDRWDNEQPTLKVSR